jgi:hypothetical protein
MPSNTFSESIFTAKVEDINYKAGTCTLSPINTSRISLIRDVPLPYLAGDGNAGVFFGIRIGSKVLAMFTSGRDTDVTVIANLIPNPNLYPNIFNPRKKPKDTPSKTLPYPTLRDGDLVLRGGSRSEISLRDEGNIFIKTVSGGGLYFKRNRNTLSTLLTSEDVINYTNAGRTIAGSVRRISGSKRKTYPIPDPSVAPLFSDPDYAQYSMPIGFFSKSKPLKRTFDTQTRNPELTEYRVVINEFATDSFFTGFDDEALRASDEKKLYDYSETYARNRELGNVLHMAEHELIEFVGGNLVDINGEILDLNYKKLYYTKDNRIPDNITVEEYDKARKISRRNIGCHFQLSTNTKRDDPSQNTTNFVFDIDKEGMLKFNVPASSDSGNIPFPVNVKYVGGAKDQVIVQNLNPSILESVPVTLRDELGNIVYPDRVVTHRRTGIRVVDENNPTYFNNNSTVTSESRVNTTKYHNMYAAAERLIANTINKVSIPTVFCSDSGLPESTAIFKPFEVATAKIETFPRYMGTIGIEPGKSAIYHGGGGEAASDGTVIAGLYYEDSDEKNPPYSNTTSKEKIESGEVASVGGKSISGNIEGSIEVSIGKDNWDQKSIVLDTAGSIISWLGKDKNGRSMVLQTDGSVLVNIGGSYEKSANGAESGMNIGRLDLRVNVTDKKFVGTTFEEGQDQDSGGNPGSDSDYIISISEQGLVIAGMKKAAPMIIRNDGPLLLESSSADVTIKGTKVITVDSTNITKVAPPASTGFSG